MKKRLLLLPLIGLVASCQQAGPNQLNRAPVQALATAYTPTPELPFTAKIVDEEAQRLAKQWSPTRALTHILCLNITSEGVPHPASGSWTYSFIDTSQRERGLQIVMRPGLKPLLRQVHASKLPQREPLEIRAWGIDSPKAIIKGRQYFGEVSLKRFELTDVKRRLIWVFGPKAMLEAIDGSQFDPDAVRR